MKTKLMRIIISLIILIMVSEFCIMPNISFAGTDSGRTLTTSTLNAISNLVGGIVSIIIWIPKLLLTGGVYIFNKIFTENVANDSGINSSFKEDVYTNITFSPFDIFFNKYKLLDVNIFDLSMDKDSIAYNIHNTSAQWFYTMRTISAIILLCILIYVGIRMAISTVAEDKAKYKQMFIDWVVSLALIFVLQYLAIFIIYMNDAIVSFLAKAVTSSNIGDAVDKILNKAAFGVGLNSIMAFIVYIMISFQTIFFLVAYINRMLKTAFLVIISPLISITYSIDKIGDGKAQALNTWLKEFTYTILIQPFHCIMYLAFVNTAVSLLIGNGGIFTSLKNTFGPEYNQIVNGFLAILCLKFINDGEKIVRKIFNFQDDNSSTSMAAGAAIGMMAVNNAKKIGSATRKGINTTKAGANKISSHIQNDSKKLNELTKSDKYKNNKLVNGLSKGLNGANALIGAGKKVGTALDKPKKAISDFRGSINKKIDGSKLGEKYNKITGDKLGQRLAYNRKKNTAKMLGVMGAAMAYSTGSTGAMEAFATGSAISKGSQELFNSSASNQADATKENVEKELAEEKEQVEKSFNEAGGALGEDLAKAEDEYDEREDKQELIDEQADKTSQARGKADSSKAKVSSMEKEKKLYDLENAVKAINPTDTLSSEEQEKLNDQKNEIAKMKKENPDIKGKDHSKEEMDKFRAVEADDEKIAEQEEAKLNYFKSRHELETFNDPDSIRERIASMATGPSKKELDEKKNEIMRLIMQIKMEENSDLASESYDSEEEDTRSQKLTKNLTEQINLGVMKNGDSSAAVTQLLNGDEMLKDPKTDGGKKKKAALEASLKQYKRMAERKDVADIFDAHSKTGGSDAVMADTIARKL